MTSMRSVLRRRTVAVAWCLLAICVLAPGFGSNGWGVADEQHFEQQNRDMEAHVMARIVKSRADGLLSAGGLLGLGTVDGRPVDFDDWEHIPVEEQFDAYVSGASFGHYEPYLSQIGAEGTLFVLVDRLAPGDEEAHLAVFGWVAAGMSAIALGLLVCWFFLELGGFAAAAVLVGAIASQWLTVFGGKMFWALWAFYLPLLVPAYYLMRHGSRRLDRRSLAGLAFAVFAGLFLKTLFNGYEYITTALVSALVPVVYYAVKHRWSSRDTVRAMLWTGFGAAAAVALSVAVLVTQIGAVRGSPAAGVEHLMQAIERRTYPSQTRYPAYEGQGAMPWDVLTLYLNGVWLDLNRFIWDTHHFMRTWILRVRFGALIVYFGLASVLLVTVGRRASGFDTPAGESRPNIALLAATWFSLLAPLSWFIIFNAHSEAHTHMNQIAWHLPFVLFGFAVAGLLVDRAVRVTKASLGDLIR